MPVPAALFELTRGQVVEATHYGHIAVVDAHGTLLADCGDPYTIAFTRSSAKPLQVLPFVEHGGVEHYGFNQAELALACASHEGSDEHVRGVASMQAKAGLREEQLGCGIHNPGDVAAYRSLIASGAAPTPNRNNCSGKHSAMLAYARLRGLPLEEYLAGDHPIQQDILAAVAAMCRLEPEQVQLGIDGCSAPNFAVPLYNAALAYARLCDPHDLPDRRARACRQVVAAMNGHPEMISGPDEFDCRLMRAGRGRLVCKRGAEGFQAVGVLPGARGPGSPGIGIALKVSDGDPGQRRLDLQPYCRVRPAVVLEILAQLALLDAEQQEELAEFGPVRTVTNHRGLVVGEARPAFRLENRARTRASKGGR